MFWRGLKQFVGTGALVGVGVAAIATQKLVSEHGPEVITGPVSAFAARLQPFGDAAKDELMAVAEKFLDVGGGAPKIEGAAVVGTPDPSAAEVEKGSPGALDLAAAVEAQTARDLQASAQCDTELKGIDVTVLGDRLALRFFEHSAMAAAPSADAPLRSESIVFERLDLSGSHEVGTDGAVSLPAIGHVDVIGRTLPCVEALVSIAASERLRLSGSVSAAFALRPPVLVRGVVRAPGAHAYSPGLTVERVLPRPVPSSLRSRFRRCSRPACGPARKSSVRLPQI